MTNWRNNIAKQLVLLAIMLMAGGYFAHAQTDIGGPDFPVIESTQRYGVAMDVATNTTAWYIYEGDETEITDITIENGTVTPYQNLGAGSVDEGLAYVDIFFDPTDFPIGNTYTIVYEELEPTGNQCQARRFYEITMQSYFRGNITGVPGNGCLVEPDDHQVIADPRGTAITHESTYNVENTEPEDYAHEWSFAYNISSTAQRTGYASPNISQVVVNIDGTETTYTPNTPDYDNFAANIPAGVTAIITVTYQVLPGSAHVCELEISSMKGSFDDYDPVSPKTETHDIQKLPAPSAITAVD